MALLSATNLVKQYDKGPILQSLNLEVRPGELLVLMGPSGCGKTTLLRVIAGLEQISAGQIRIGERDITTVPTAERNIALVFQDYALFPHLDVAHNIGIGLTIRKVPKQQWEQRVKTVAETVGCEKLLGRSITSLSGGEQQRVALARALVREPQVLLLDEPLSNVDLQLRQKMRSELRLLQQRLKTTTVYVTHDQVEALALADRIAVMHEGAIEQIGSPDAVYKNPATKFVASFLGSPPMNLWPITVNKTSLQAGPFRWDIRKGRTEKMIEVGIRPEDVQIDYGGRVEAVVKNVELAGSQRYVYFEVDQLPLIALVGADRTIKPGQRVKIELPLDRMHFFDTAGKTISHLDD